MSEIFLYIIIAIIWAIIALINQANKKQSGKPKKATKQSVKKYQQDKLEDEEILKNLNETLNKNLNNTLNSKKTIKEPQIEKFKKKEEVKENKTYEISYKDREMLELQKKYNSIMDNKNNIENTNFENFSFEKKASNVSNMISSLDIKNAIIYNAILEPKRLNYKRKIIKS